MSSIQQRLATFLAEYNLSAQAFERKCNIGVATASKLSANSRETTFRKIEKAFPQLNIDWLKTGDGQMLKPTPTIDVDFSIRQTGDCNSAFSDINDYGNAKSRIAVLCERVASLENQLAEKDARIVELTASLNRERKVNDFLMASVTKMDR